MPAQRESSHRRVWLGTGQIALGVGVLAACAPGIAVVDTPEDCSLDGRLQYVEDRMTDEYLWAAEVQPPDRFGYTDPTVYLTDLRYAALDRWSYARDLTEASEWFETGGYVGAGYVMRFDDAGSRRFALVYPEGPAGRAGIVRGDQLLRLNGEPVENLTTAELWAEAFGPVEAGAVVQMEVDGPDAGRRTADVVLDTVTTPPVLGARVWQVGDRTVGYFLLTSFIETAHDALDAVFADFQDAGVDTVFIDLRYNGGGLNAVARHLAGLVLPGHEGAVYQTYWYNDRHTRDNTATYIESHDSALSARDVVVFTTGATASASEMLAFGLEPYLPVHRVGQTTGGKPVGMNHFEACDLFVAPVTFQAGNRDHRATYFDGLAPDCAAPDDLAEALGADADPMVVAALATLGGQDCPHTDPTATVRLLPEDVRFRPWTELQGGVQ